MNGFTDGGYKLVYTDRVPAWMNDVDGDSNFFDGSTSLGFSVGARRATASGGTGATVANVWWGSPAFKGGIKPDSELVAVNNVAYTAKLLRAAIVSAEKSHIPIELVFRSGKEYQTVSMPYFDGLRYPTLERIDATPDRLDQIFEPSKSPLPPM
jgi:predicted metalloprotease with PDZ domain